MVMALTHIVFDIKAKDSYSQAVSYAGCQYHQIQWKSFEVQ